MAALFRTRLHYGPPLFGYVLACALIAISGAGRLALMTNGNTRGPFVLFYPAIAIASFLAGAGPGLAAVFASAAFAAVLFPAPQSSNWISLSVLGPLMATGFAHLRKIREDNRATARECGRFRFISDHASDWLFLTNATGEIEYGNQAAAVQFGLEASELTGRRLGEFVSESQRSILGEMLALCQLDNPTTAEFTFEHSDRASVSVEARCTAVKAQNGIVLHVAARDITERKEMEDKLRDAQKWESLGVMAGGLAHDFNNLLTSIMGNASLAREYLSAANPARAQLTEIEMASERSAELVRLMLATAGYRSRVSEISTVDKILEQTLAVKSVPHHIRVLTDVEEPNPRGDCLSISTVLGSTVLESLISNAAEAYGPIPGDVRVRICAGEAPTLEPASFEEGSAGGECVGIIVEDRGCGMTKEVLQRAFDPFFTTKFMGRGLGLPAVRGLVRAHSGKLWMRTEPGKGTRVEVWLPKS